jgi:hypothetical protein
MVFDKNGNLQIGTLAKSIKFYESEYKKTFGLVDISSSSALGTDLAITAEMRNRAEENLQQAFLQNNPSTATGKALDALAFLAGIKRKKNEHSLVLLEFKGADGTVIPSNTEVKHVETSSVFATENKGVITDGSYYVFAKAVVAGRVVCDAQKLTVTELADVTVSNPRGGVVGYLIESDTSLRARVFDYEKALNTEEQLRKKLLNLQNVKFVKIISNPTLQTDSNNIPAKATSIVVGGGENQVVAKEIFKNLSSDKLLIGEITETVKSDITGSQYYVKFSRPKIVPVTVDVAITVDATFTELNKLQVETSILSFFEATYRVGDSVIQDRIFIPAQQDFKNNNYFFKGVKNVEVLVNGATDNVPVNYNELAVLNSDSLTVTVSVL